MHIPYMIRNTPIIKICRDFVAKNHANLTIPRQRIQWHTIWRGAFGGKSIAMIEKGTHFEADFTPAHPTLFCARLRALATALKEAGLFYLYYMTYDPRTGIITVQRIDGSDVKQRGVCAVLIPVVRHSDDWWKELQQVLKQALKNGIKISEIIFIGGGDVSVPDWFREWCLTNGIQIVVLSPEEYVVQYEHSDAIEFRQIMTQEECRK